MGYEHTAMFTMDGPQDIVHPDGEPSGCDFEDYLERDWSQAMQFFLGPWIFYREEGGVWNGTQL